MHEYQNRAMHCGGTKVVTIQRHEVHMELDMAHKHLLTADFNHVCTVSACHGTQYLSSPSQWPAVQLSLP